MFLITQRQACLAFSRKKKKEKKTLCFCPLVKNSNIELAIFLWVDRRVCPPRPNLQIQSPKMKKNSHRASFFGL